MVLIETLEPMESVSMDHFSTDQGLNLGLVDRASGLQKHFKTRGLTTEEVIKNVNPWFLQVGYPQEIRSDGGPAFRQTFTDWCTEKGIRHDTSSPYAPSSNGLAKNGVKQMKTLWKKCIRER